MGDVYGIFLAQRHVADNVRRAFPGPGAEGPVSGAPRGGELRRRVGRSLRQLADRVEPAPHPGPCVSIAA